MPDAAGFHDAFAAALAGDALALAAGWGGDADLAPGLTVYRNTIAKGCADALVAQFPTLVRLVGEAWLGAAAVEFARAHPPRTASLLGYGQDFPDWLATFPPAADMPHLAGVARLDMLWTEAHLAADAPALAPDALTGLDAGDLARLNATPHPATRIARFEATIPSLWRALQAETPPEAFDLEASPEALLFVRPSLDIDHRVVGPGVVALIEASGDGASLARAGALALAAEPSLALDRAFAELIALGAFTRLVPTEPA